ncbi:MAG: DedA family protein [Bacteroidetes bacterium]|nr:DedA family protein [Bacteroidota bacterium]MCL5026368.1 DedA family protein [Chloroflexota bacterium]
MLAALEQHLIPLLEQLYAQMGYLGVMIAMAIESACIPLPSEIVLPMAGWMVSRGVFDLWWVTLAGTFGCTLGSAVAYWVGAFGGRPVLERYGRYILVSTHDLEKADQWFTKYGDAAIFFSRLMPVVRTFISFPAGVTRMNFLKFLLYTTAGSFPWSLGLVFAGKLMGDNWQQVREVLHNFDYPILAAIAIGVVLYVYRHLRKSRSVVSSTR